MKKHFSVCMIVVLASVLFSACGGGDQASLNMGVRLASGLGGAARTAYNTAPDSFKVVIKKAEIRRGLSDRWQVVYEGEALRDITTVFDYLMQGYPVDPGDYRGVRFTIDAAWVVTKEDPFSPGLIHSYTNASSIDTHMFLTADVVEEILAENPSFDTNNLKLLTAPFAVEAGDNTFVLAFDTSAVLTFYTNESSITNWALNPPQLTVTKQ